MYKRTLYVNLETQKKIDELATLSKKSKAEILRQAVEIGLRNMNNPSVFHTPHTKPSIYTEKPQIVSSIEHEDATEHNDVLTRLLKLILK